MRFLPFRKNRSNYDSEQATLLDHKDSQPNDSIPLLGSEQSQAQRKSTSVATMIFRWILFIALYHVIIRGLGFWASAVDKRFDKLPSDPHEAAKRILEKAPVIVSIHHLVMQCFR